MTSLTTVKEKIIEDVKNTFPESEWTYRIEAINWSLSVMSEKNVAKLAEKIKGLRKE